MILLIEAVFAMAAVYWAFEGLLFRGLGFLSCLSLPGSVLGEVAVKPQRNSGAKSPKLKS